MAADPALSSEFNLAFKSWCVCVLLIANCTAPELIFGNINIDCIKKEHGSKELGMTASNISLQLQNKE